MSTLGQDFAYAWRKPRRQPAWTALAVCTLALGIGANTAIFSALEMVFLRPLPYRQAEQLVILWPESWFSKSEFDYYRSGFESLEGLSAIEPQSVTLTGLDEPERLDGLQVSSSLFPLLGVQPAWGRPFTQAEDRPGGGRVAVISYGLWQRVFAGDPAAFEDPVTLNGQPHRIVGVLPAGTGRLRGGPGRDPGQRRRPDAAELLEALGSGSRIRSPRRPHPAPAPFRRAARGGRSTPSLLPPGG